MREGWGICGDAGRWLTSRLAAVPRQWLLRPYPAARPEPPVIASHCREDQLSPSLSRTRVSHALPANDVWRVGLYSHRSSEEVQPKGWRTWMGCRDHMGAVRVGLNGPRESAARLMVVGTWGTTVPLGHRTIQCHASRCPVRIAHSVHKQKPESRWLRRNHQRQRSTINLKPWLYHKMLEISRGIVVTRAHVILVNIFRACQCAIPSFCIPFVIECHVYGLADSTYRESLTRTRTSWNVY